MARPLKGRRIIVLCEGKTEERAVRYFVARQWAAEGLASVGLDRKDLHAHLEKVGTFASNYLDERDVLAVFTLIDLYKMTRVRHEPADQPDTKVERVRRWLTDQVKHPRAPDFYPHVSVHEVEAWILAEGTALATRLHDANITADREAESRNFQKPPSARLNELCRTKKKRSYQKIEDGEPLFSKMEFQPVYSSCRYFRAFYDDLKRVANQAGVAGHESRV